MPPEVFASACLLAFVLNLFIERAVLLLILLVPPVQQALLSLLPSSFPSLTQTSHHITVSRSPQLTLAYRTAPSRTTAPSALSCNPSNTTKPSLWKNSAQLETGSEVASPANPARTPILRLKHARSPLFVSSPLPLPCPHLTNQLTHPRALQQTSAAPP